MHPIADNTLYFAYGSNLNTADWEAFCQRIGADPQSIEPIDTAILPDHALAFDYYSSSRGGGALNLRPQRGHIVHGMLFKASAEGWAALDRKEGSPHCYQRQSFTTLLANGRAQPATSYVVTPARRHPSGFCAPTAEYAGIVRRGLQHWQLPDSGLKAALRAEDSAAEIDHVFVYGTLREGESNAHLIPAQAIIARHRAEIRGSLTRLISIRVR